MKLLVCGGRDYQDRDFVFRALDKADKGRVLLVIHGACGDPEADRLEGADRWADEWAKSLSIATLPFPVTKAEWKEHGKKAGPMRNQRMIHMGAPNGVVAFPGNRGTEDMIRRARRARLGVWDPAGVWQDLLNEIG